jgi:hypothetical protein
MDENEKGALARMMSKLMAAGLETKVEPFPPTEREFAKIVDELRALEPNDIKGKLIVAGFMDHPYGLENWRCADCIYYLANRRWCDLPELALPVEPDWYCRLWRM